MLAEEIPKFFCQNLRPYGIQNNDQKTDGVDRVNQHPQSFIVVSSSWVNGGERVK